MQRVCFVFEVFEGKEAEYKKRHDEIWPELVEAIRRGVQIVAYFEVEPDAKTAFAKLSKYEANARWSEWFRDVIVNLTDNQGNLMEMTEVWHLD
jgi:L-rhamnose mutarotase